MEKWADKGSVEKSRTKRGGLLTGERGFTLPEVTITIVILGIILSIATSSWLGIVEQRDIDSAANQFKADMRLAHSGATNRLGTAQIIFDPDNRVNGDQVGCNGVQADYCLVQPTSGTPQVKPRFLPDRAGISNPNLPINTGALPTGVTGVGNLVSIQFSANGSVNTTPAISAAITPTVRVGTTDNTPGHDVTFNTVTSRIKVD